MREKAQISFCYEKSPEQKPMKALVRAELLRPQSLRSGFTFNQKGASAIEYILLLVVVVSLLLTLTQIFWKPFGSFLDSYVGGYTQCLLEVGELPVLKGQTEVAADLEECRAEFSAKIANNVQGQKTNSQSSSSSSSKRERNEREQAERASLGRGNSRAVSRMNSSSSRGTDSGGPGDGKSQQVELAEDGSGFYRTRNQSSASSNLGRPQRTSEQRVTLSLSDNEREQLKRAQPKRTPAEATLGAIKQPVKKMIVKEPPSTKNQNVNEEAFNFGNLIRIMILLAILVLIFILFGAFILQVRQTVRKES
jgi:hypothetical protein